MQIKLFTIPIGDNNSSQDELNKFLRTHKILEVENHLMNNERGAVWCFCVKYIDEYTNAPDKIKIDYRQVLDEQTFSVFSKLREARKAIAIDEGIPAYAVFTDEELAGLAKLEKINIKTMQTVKGIGEKKVERFAEKFIIKINA